MVWCRTCTSATRLIDQQALLSALVHQENAASLLLLLLLQILNISSAITKGNLLRNFFFLI